MRAINPANGRIRRCPKCERKLRGNAAYAAHTRVCVRGITVKRTVKRARGVRISVDERRRRARERDRVQRERESALRSKRFCICGCGVELTGSAQQRRTPACREAMHLQASRGWHQANRDDPVVKSKAADRQAARWNANPERSRKHARETSVARRRRYRLAALEAYGGKCTCCGESRWQFLTLQHTKQDGAAHRKELACKRHDSAKFLRKLVAAGFPKDRGIEVLCSNCHVAEDLHGGCPHKGPHHRAFHVNAIR